MKTEKTKRKSRGDDYVNNKDFSTAVVEYVVAPVPWKLILASTIPSIELFTV
jgi:hypothetical protein